MRLLKIVDDGTKYLVSLNKYKPKNFENAESIKLVSLEDLKKEEIDEIDVFFGDENTLSEILKKGEKKC